MKNFDLFCIVLAQIYLQPENLLIDLSSSSSVPLIKLIDFGDARHIYDETYIHRVMGSAEFAAPELVTGKPASLKSDMWLVYDGNLVQVKSLSY